jgi:hypothetical protein
MSENSRSTGAPATPSGHSRAEPFGLGASPECPSRGQAAAESLASRLQDLGKIQDDPEWWEHRDLCNTAAAEIVRLQAEVDRLTIEADGEYVRAACRVMQANPGFDARDYEDGITADEFEAFFTEDMAEAWRQRKTPLMPTEAMLEAAQDWSHAKYGKPIGNDAAIGCWQAMLRASPASCDGSAEGGETQSGSTEGNSAVGEAETPEVLPKSPSPLPDDKTAGMTVEEAREVLSELDPLSGSPRTHAAYHRDRADILRDGELSDAHFRKALRIETALLTLQSEKGDQR